MDIADRTCNLECIQKGPPRYEFVGPVKIILVDPLPGDYKRKKWGSALLTLAMLIMGITVFTVFFFTLRFELPSFVNAHIFLCTMGYQLFLPSGILMINGLFGGAAQLKPEDRKFQHFFLQVCAIACGVSGSGLIVIAKGVKLTAHSVTGGLTACLLGLTTLIGPTVYFTNQSNRYGKFNYHAHVFFGIPSFLMATVSFILGLLRPSFVNWAPVKDLHYILIGFTVIYSLSVLASIYLRAKLKE